MSDERPSASAPGSPTPLQQLEAALATGAITPELFATLSAQLPPDQPTAPPAPAQPVFSPSGNDEELPSLLDMFNQPPAAPPSPPPVPAPAAAPPTPASPARTSAADAAARRLIEERLTQIRQRPAPEPAPPTPTPIPAPAPTFYPEAPAPAPAVRPVPSAPTFYPTTPEPASPPPAPPRQVPPRASVPPTEPATGGVGKWLLLALLVLAVGGALAYFFIQNSHPDESLTSPSLPAAESAPTEVAAPKPVKKTKKSSKKKRKKKETTPVATAAEAEAVSEEEAVASQPEPEPVAAPVRAAPTTSRPIAAAPEAGDDAATTRVREALASYYADLNAPPLHASQHFAPQVERLYIQQNLTPAAIDAELARSFFPENQQAVAQVEPGTLRVSAPAADGSRMATFTETMRLYRVSKQQFQRLRTNVRVRFNTDYQITYMRQEKLLANTFE